jgi:hypothetical protein
MIIGIAFQHSMSIGLVFTSYVYRYGHSACYVFMVGLKEIQDCRS